MTSANTSLVKKNFPSGWKCYKTIGSYISCAFIEIWSTWEIWRALKKPELLSAMPWATLTHLSCSPNFPHASYLNERAVTYEPIVNEGIILHPSQYWCTLISHRVKCTRFSVGLCTQQFFCLCFCFCFVFFLIRKPLLAFSWFNQLALHFHNISHSYQSSMWHLSISGMFYIHV